MGKRGGKKGFRGRGGGGGNRPRQDTRTDKANIVRQNDKFEQYYNQLGLVPADQVEEFWEAMRRDLPNSFRFTGSRAHALAVQQRLRDFYIPEITAITYEGQVVETPQPVKWYPDQLAWFMTTPKHVIRRFKPFASFQKFLVAETDVGNINRQEVVSMIPPLVMDIKPGMTVLDLCAAPGSKSAQLIEMIHAGEEERSEKVASNLRNGLGRPEGQDYEDDGRSTGLLIANDVDYKRAHMLVHQMKRLSSPNIIITNHDATVFPSIKIPSLAPSDGKPVQNRYLKFDRILADVPCSGDGTPRKNLEIWNKWNPSNALGLHMTQVRILIRALQMLKVGGRVVYSTCSMNPVEDEAVVAAAIDRCGGSQVVDIIETKDLLPGLRRCPGMRQWSIVDKFGRTWTDYDAVLKQKAESGDEGLSRLQESMFPPKEDLPLERAIRVYPHQQDTGAFFVTILEKRSEIKVRPEEKPSTTSEPAQVEVVDPDGTFENLETAIDGEIAEITNETTRSSSPDGPLKRKRNQETTTEEAADPKRVKSSTDELNGPEKSSPKPDESVTQPEENHNSQSASARPQNIVERPESNSFRKKPKNEAFEEPFKYLSPDIPELQQIQSFYKLSDRFPLDRFMVRNAQSTASKNIYYTTALAKAILQENEGKGMKFVHSGVKMFVKQDAPAPDVCPWRIQTDGLRILETWVGKERVVTLNKRETLRKLLIEMFPRFAGDDWKNLGEVGPQVRDLGMGCCVLIVEPSDEEDGLKERMVFPLWKSIQSLNLMLPKEERKAMLLRLFNDDTPLVNMSQGWKKATENGTAGEPKSQDKAEDDMATTDVRLRNSSSPDPNGSGEANGNASDIEADGDVELETG